MLFKTPQTIAITYRVVFKKEDMEHSFAFQIHTDQRDAAHTLCVWEEIKDTKMLPAYF